MIIKDIMTPDPLTINLLSGVKRAEQIMREKKIGSLPVVDNEKLVGIITSRDIRRSHPNRIVADAMTSNVIVLTPYNTLWEAKDLMENNGIERLVITNKDSIVGILTKSDLYKEIGKYIDNLTGMYRKEYLLAEALRLLENNKPFSFLFTDLDKFGEIDKNFGHEIGDKIITEVSRLLKKFDNDKISICRFGGDEFVLLLDGGKESAVNLAIKLIDEFQSHQWTNHLDIHTSIGIAVMNPQNKSINSENGYSVITELLNKASIASTNAKKLSVKYLVVEF